MTSRFVSLSSVSFHPSTFSIIIPRRHSIFPWFNLFSPSPCHPRCIIFTLLFCAGPVAGIFSLTNPNHPHWCYRSPFFSLLLRCFKFHHDVSLCFGSVSPSPCSHLLPLFLSLLFFEVGMFIRGFLLNVVACCDSGFFVFLYLPPGFLPDSINLFCP